MSGLAACAECKTVFRADTSTNCSAIHWTQKDGITACRGRLVPLDAPKAEERPGPEKKARRMQGNRSVNRAPSPGNQIDHRVEHDWNEGCDMSPKCQPVEAAPIEPEPPKPEPRKQWLFTEGGRENYSNLSVQFADGKGFITTGSVREFQPDAPHRISRDEFEEMYEVFIHTPAAAKLAFEAALNKGGIVVEE